MPRRAIAQFRSGDWRRRQWSPVLWIGLVALLGDVLTTAHVLTAPEYYESNPTIAGLASVHVGLGLAYIALIGAVILAVAAYSFGWLSRVAAGVAVVHLAFPLNNLVLFATGESLFEQVGLDLGVATTLLIPAAGVAIGLVWEGREFGLPYREAVLVVCAVAVVVLANASLL